ncbi:hypothetical protein CsatB_017398 [Cannabis sativa]
MKPHWDGRFPAKISEKEPELFMISFGCEGDKERVLTQEPWHFQNHHIVLYKPTPLQNVTPSDLKFSPFWIQVYRLPFLSKSRGLAVALGNIIGKFLEVYTDSLNEGWGPFLRIRVNIDVTKPLRRGRNIRLQQVKDKFWVEFRYERLPEWCMECGCLGHPYQKCQTFLELLDNGIEPELAYGPEIKGAALPSSGYDRYRTDFSKGNAWPLLTRLARKTIVDTIPSFPIRNQPQPRQLLYGESSNAGNQPHKVSTDVGIDEPQNSPLLANMNSNRPLSFAPATLAAASLVPKHVHLPTPAINEFSGVHQQKQKLDSTNFSASASVADPLGKNKGISEATTNLNFHGLPINSKPHGLQIHGVSKSTLVDEISTKMNLKKGTNNSPFNTVSPASPNESDLSDLYMPNVGQQAGIVATYPPETMHTQPLNVRTAATSHHIQYPTMTDSTICMLPTGADCDKENSSPNRANKRLPEKLSLRKTLKRCRGPKPILSTSELSTDTEMYQHVSEFATDSTDILDNDAEAVLQPRTQP